MTDEEVRAALFPATVRGAKYTPRLFVKEMKRAGITCNVSSGRILLDGGPSQERERLCCLLRSKPDLEARLILAAGMKDSDVMDSIKERACIRWAEGYSDSLYDAVMCNIRERAEEVCRDSEGRIIALPRTDWEAELSRYCEEGV